MDCNQHCINLKATRETENAIQILHINKDHWAVITTVGSTQCNQVKYYDSAYSSLSFDTQKIIAKLLQPSRFSINEIHVQIMVTPKQIGCTECGLYAIAISTSLAFGIDPSQHIFNQDDMCSRLQ